MPDPNKPTLFPRDCPRDCPHFRAWDMSIDDWTCRCDLLNVQIDECDMDYQRVRCPLDDASDRLGKICEDHGLTPEGVEFALTQYQKIICEITHGMLSKLTYEADHVLEVAQERWCETCDLNQEPRVLTMEEVQNDCPDYVYMEIESGWIECCLKDEGDSTASVGYFVYGFDEFFIEGWKEYGKTWRCWDKRPTGEQRKEMKWDG